MHDPVRFGRMRGLFPDGMSMPRNTSDPRQFLPNVFIANLRNMTRNSQVKTPCSVSKICNTETKQLAVELKRIPTYGCAEICLISLRRD